jgi:hypothetical protein
MAGFEKVARNRLAHLAKTDETNVHSSLPRRARARRRQINGDLRP